MYVHPEDAHADPLTQQLGTLANRLAQHYQAGNYVAAAFDLGEMHSHVFEHFTHDWCNGIVEWITDALDVCEQAARPAPPHFRVTVDDLPFELGQAEPTCDCLSCNALAGYAVTIEFTGTLEDEHRTSRCCGSHLDMVANAMLENIGSSIRLRNDIDTVAHV